MIKVLVEITPAQARYLHFLEVKKPTEEPIYINQNQACKRFGKANVMRWAKQLLVMRYYRPKGVDYKMSELLSAAANYQDYDK